MKKIISMMMVFSIILCMMLSISVTGESYNGKCGPTANWVLENGVLTISGEGELYSVYNDSDRHPDWFEYRKSIQKIVVNEGITTINGGNTFYDHSNLKTVIFPTTLRSIGVYAFNKCHNISYIDWKYWSPKLVLMYAADGRVRLFNEDEVDTYKKLSWYIEPMQTLYTLDGRSEVFKKSEVQAQLTVGWYETPVVLMYALDGRTLVIPQDEIVAYENVGWYYGKPTKLWSGNGKYCWVGENRLKDTVIMYALDGRIQAVRSSEILANEKVGWYYGKPTKMYAPDGRVITIGENRVAEYKKVGWYTTPVPVTAAKEEKIPVLSKADNVKNAIAYMETALKHYNTAFDYLKKIDVKYQNGELVASGSLYLIKAKDEYVLAKNDLDSATKILKQYGDCTKIVEHIGMATIVLEVFIEQINISDNAWTTAYSITKNTPNFLNYMTDATLLIQKLNY